MSGKSVYIPGFDYLRIAAVFAVVWIHGSDTNILAKNLQSYTSFAVPSFVLMSGFLMQRAFYTNDKLDYFGLLSSRFGRLIPAYAAWSAVYVLMRLGKHFFLTNTSLELDWALIVFGGGASYQLWFVPALLVWMLLFGYIALVLSKRHVGPIGSTALIFGGCALIYIGERINSSLVVSDNYSLIIHSTIGFLGYFPLSMGIAQLLENGKNKVRTISFILAPLLMLLVAFLVEPSAVVNKIPAQLFPVILFLFTLLFTRRLTNKYLLAVSKYAFGIYLCHALFVEGLQLVLPRIGFSIISFNGAVFVILGAFLLSAITCMVLGQKKETRWLVA